ncbi:MAG: extracellular solute-binding protein [Marmoricola sp.]|nr:extracellular solute-binding protein [Marmoricola sp.]
MELTRRSFVKRMSFAALAAGVGGPVLAACAGPDKGAAAGGAVLKAPASGTGTMNMRIWGAYPEFVKERAREFTDSYGTKVDLGVVAGDYPSIIQTQLRQNQKLDLFYGLGHLPKGWNTAGWLHDYERFWNKDKAEAEMLPVVRDALTIDGKLIGLPYFAFVNGALFANKQVLATAGLDSWPTTYDELYAQVRKVKKSGASDTPYLPSFWSAPYYGIPFGFVQEAMNRGMPMFGAGGKPEFDENSGGVVDMLGQWRDLYSENLVPKGVLTFQESDWIETFAAGGIAYSPQLQYDLRTFNDPAKSKSAGQFVAVPQQGQKWGMMHMGIYLTGNNGQSDEDLAQAYSMAEYFGYRDRKSGEFVVPTKWAAENNLTQGYAEVNNSPTVEKAVRAWLPDADEQWPILKDYMADPQYAKGLYHTDWALEWVSEASRQLPQAVNGDADIKKVVRTLREKAEKLIEEYGE